jgi:hypothetical protein
MADERRPCVRRGQVGLAGRVSYLFMGEHGEYYGGDCFCLHLGLQFSPGIVTDRIELSDMSSGDQEIIKVYYRRRDNC